jgi:hypothetical protein
MAKDINKVVTDGSVKGRTLDHCWHLGRSALCPCGCEETWYRSYRKDQHRAYSNPGTSPDRNNIAWQNEVDAIHEDELGAIHHLLRISGAEDDSYLRLVYGGHQVYAPLD